MPLAGIVAHAAMNAFAEALGVSGAAHALALGLWISPTDPVKIAGAAGLGTGLGAVIALRSRVFPAMRGAVVAIGQPSSFLTEPHARDALLWAWIAAVGALASLLLRRAGASPVASAHNVSIGLGVTAMALLAAVWAASTRGAGSPPARRKEVTASRDTPTFLAATLAGAAHGLGVWPGASRVGLASAVLIALGVRPIDALTFSAVATVPFWWADFFAALADPGTIGKGDALLVTLFAFLGAAAAISVARALSRARALIALPLWMIPLSCAIFAYSKAA